MTKLLKIPPNSKAKEMPNGSATHLTKQQKFIIEHLKSMPNIDRHSYLYALVDAANICDAMAYDIQEKHTVRGKVTKQGLQLAHAVTLAGNAIWSMREKLRRS